VSHGKAAARDLRYGRRGGRWAPDPQSERDVASIERFKAERDALAAAAEAQPQLDLWGDDAS
jgi:hypothetical protein